MTMHCAVMRRESGTPPSGDQGLNRVDHRVDCAARIAARPNHELIVTYRAGDAMASLADRIGTTRCMR